MWGQRDYYYFKRIRNFLHFLCVHTGKLIFICWKQHGFDWDNKVKIEGIETCLGLKTFLVIKLIHFLKSPLNDKVLWKFILFSKLIIPHTPPHPPAPPFFFPHSAFSFVFQNGRVSRGRCRARVSRSNCRLRPPLAGSGFCHRGDYTRPAPPRPSCLSPPP